MALVLNKGPSGLLRGVVNNLVLVLSTMLLGAGEAMAQYQPPTPTGPPGCEPCWIEPWLCKKPPCRQDPIKQQPPLPGSRDCQPCWIEPWLCKKPVCPQHPLKPTASNAQPQSRTRPRLLHQKLTGTVTSLGIVQEEPAETPQATFNLQVREWHGKSKDIIVSMPAHKFLCNKGDRATLVGDLLPDDAEMPAVLTSPRLVACSRRAANRKESR